MPKTISQVFKLNAGKFAQSGAFDALLDVDSKLFIDPHLLQKATIPEFTGARQTVQEHFAKVLKVLTHSSEKGDVFWRRAQDLLTFPEVQGLCIGYGKEGTAGSGIGPDLRDRLLKTAKQIIDAGIKDPEIFELIGLIEEDIGPDRISDMMARIIRHHLHDFTKRVFKQHGIPAKAKNPYSGTQIILVPKVLLAPFTGGP